ncbi:UNVERIFIED_CONTAM: hypothetical protein B566_EDAN019385 [Ephemera danica]|nr:hypothetical protein B566_EDAN019385 [Ephemera danica]
MDSDLEAFSHNPTDGSFTALSFQTTRVNNPTRCEFCFTMIGRADIEGSKSNVDMNSWLPQASYPCGSIGHGFPVCIPTENQNQCSFYPFVLREISVLTELHLGRLRYGLTGIPPQTNSPPNHVFRKNQTKIAFNFRTGLHQFFLHEISKMTTWVVVLQARLLSHLGYTPLRLESSSTGSSFPADYSKPVPLAVGSLDNDEAFGYLKRVIVTPAVYPRLVELRHFDIQSTGQKSHCVITC